MATSAELRGSDTSRLNRLAAPAGLGAAALLTTLALHFRDPHVEGSWGQCPLNLVTGLDCPGCGGLRAVNNLTNFDLAGAALPKSVSAGDWQLPSDGPDIKRKIWTYLDDEGWPAPRS